MSATEQQTFDAIKAAIDAALTAGPGTAPADRRAYEVDNVPTARPETYVAVQLSRRYIEGFRMGGPNGMRGGRLATRYVAKYIDDTRELKRRTRAALEDVVLSTPGGDVGPFRFETEDVGDPRDGWVSSYDLWTFANPA